MKFKHKIRQPKKPKKVTLARIREIVKEVFEELHSPPTFLLGPEVDKALKQELKEELKRPRIAYLGEENAMHFPPLPIKPVPPPPRVFAKKIADLPPIALPNEFEVEEEKI